MTFIRSFPPVSDPRAKILILGSMPGVMSLEASQYYAHPRNHFWRIMGGLIGAGASLPYPERLEILKARHIALWDVLQTCIRPGSLDSNITQETANDFQKFFTAHPGIARVFFNGAPAAKLFRKFVLPEIEPEQFQFSVLPSTSPANASYSFERKLKLWRESLSLSV